MAENIALKLVKYLPTVIAMQIFKIFWIGQASLPGKEKKDTTEISRLTIKGRTILFFVKISIIFPFSPPVESFIATKKFEKAAWISDFEKREHTAAFQNSVSEEINSRK